MKINQDSQELCDTVKHKSARSGASSARDARMVKTDQALRGALLALLERKPLEHITIRQIAAEASIHYATFFRHHPTKEALLDHVAADEIDRLVELSLHFEDTVDTHAGFVALCAYVSDHRALWTALLTGGAAGAMREEFLRVSRELAKARAPKDGWLPVELATTCTVTLIVETISWWLKQPPEAFSIERVAQILHRLVCSPPLQFDKNINGAVLICKECDSVA
jgi:AcrR family transcriptional regulator